MSKELETLRIIDDLLDNYIDEAQVVDCPMTKERLIFLKRTFINVQEQEKFIDIIKRKGMYISAKELTSIQNYEDYKDYINVRKLQQELMMHITPTLINWDNLDNTVFYTEEEFNTVKEVFKNE